MAPNLANAPKAEGLAFDSRVALGVSVFCSGGHRAQYRYYFGSTLGITLRFVGMEDMTLVSEGITLGFARIPLVRALSNQGGLHVLPGFCLHHFGVFQGHRSHFGSRYPLGLMHSARAF